MYVLSENIIGEEQKDTRRSCRTLGYAHLDEIVLTIEEKNLQLKRK